MKFTPNRKSVINRKRRAFIPVLFFLFFCHTTIAQGTSHLQLQTPYPAPGQFLSGVYNPAGTALAGKKHIDATVYYFVDKTYYANNTELKPLGTKWNFEVFVPAAAKVLLFTFTDGKELDNNNGQGYITLIYKKKQAVPGAYASEATLFSGMGAVTGKIKIDADKAIALFEKEFAMHPSRDHDLKRYYYYLLVEAKKPGAADMVTKEVTLLQNSDNEKDLLLAGNYLSLLGRTKSADSLKQVVRVRFPNGGLVRDELFMSFLSDKDTKHQQQKFDLIEQRFPEKDNTDVSNYYDGVRLQLAKSYLEDGIYDQYEKYYNLVKNKTGLDLTINQVAYTMALAGTNLPLAQTLSKQALAIVEFNLKNIFDTKPASQSSQQWQNTQQQVYLNYSDTYAYILFRMGKYQEAAAYIQPVFERLGSSSLQIIEHYALMMGAAGYYQKAVPVIEKLIKQGKTSPALLDELKKAYIKIKGSDAGYANYLAALKAVYEGAGKGDLAREMLYKPAPPFALKDLKGNTVSLADLKGKIILLYFWATWNEQCKAALPGLQAVVNKYRDSPDVKILLIDTWENGTNYQPELEKYVEDKPYLANVLVDEKDDSGKQARVASSYHIEGLPNKILIDKQGNVRFIHAGFVGLASALVDEVSAMIDTALKP